MPRTKNTAPKRLHRVYTETYEEVPTTRARGRAFNPFWVFRVNGFERPFRITSKVKRDRFVELLMAGVPITWHCRDFKTD